MALVLASDNDTEALALGRLIWIPDTCAVAVRMNITNTTMSTSTNGVTLMLSTAASSSSSCEAFTLAMTALLRPVRAIERDGHGDATLPRSAERRGGKEWVSPCETRRVPV